MAQIVKDHWAKLGRNSYSRYDYEGGARQDANQMHDQLQQIVNSPKHGDSLCAFEIATTHNSTPAGPPDAAVAKNH